MYLPATGSSNYILNGRVCGQALLTSREERLHAGQDGDQAGPPSVCGSSDARWTDLMLPTPASSADRMSPLVSRV